MEVDWRPISVEMKSDSTLQLQQCLAKQNPLAPLGAGNSAASNKIAIQVINSSTSKGRHASRDFRKWSHFSFRLVCSFLFICSFGALI